MILINFLNSCHHIYSLCVRPKTKITLEEEMLCFFFLPEQINFISMNSRAQCFLVAHVNRQEANLTWSGHTPLLTEERERERERSALTTSERQQEGKDAAAGGEKDRRSVTARVGVGWGWGGRGREGEAAETDVRAQPLCL